MNLNGLVEISSVFKLPSQVLKRTTKYTDARLKATKVNSNFIIILVTLLVVSIIIVMVTMVIFNIIFILVETSK